MLYVMECCKRRFRIAVAKTSSPNMHPHCICDFWNVIINEFYNIVSIQFKRRHLLLAHRKENNPSHIQSALRIC
uniref:Uncharacterized protein n=1 Tax=Bacillus cereus VPC1401 TaxID=870739 RepID=E5AK68_BACCE|nr:hypothetical protein pLVP1401_57 [Bacillus cereus VPC1401]